MKYNSELTPNCALQKILQNKKFMSVIEQETSVLILLRDVVHESEAGLQHTNAVSREPTQSSSLRDAIEERAQVLHVIQECLILTRAPEPEPKPDKLGLFL